MLWFGVPLYWFRQRFGAFVHEFIVNAWLMPHIQRTPVPHADNDNGEKRFA